MADDWKAELLRVTAFTSIHPGEHAMAWWESAVGEAPETDRSELRKHERVVSGEFHEHSLTLRVQMNRVDWLWAAKLEGPTPNPETLGPLSDVGPRLLELTRVWFDHPTLPEIRRIALGAVLVSPVDSLQEGYGQLDGYLPSVRVDVEGATDFLFQINRPRKSKSLEGLMLNRLCKWNVAVVNLMAVEGAAVVPGGERHHCRLELDLNSSPKWEDGLPVESLQGLMGEFVELASEISLSGDNP